MKNERTERMERLTAQLKAIYDRGLAEPMPRRFIELLARLK